MGDVEKLRQELVQQIIADLKVTAHTDRGRIADIVRLLGVDVTRRIAERAIKEATPVSAFFALARERLPHYMRRVAQRERVRVGGAWRLPSAPGPADRKYRGPIPPPKPPAEQPGPVEPQAEPPEEPEQLPEEHGAEMSLVVRTLIHQVEEQTLTVFIYGCNSGKQLSQRVRIARRFWPALLDTLGAPRIALKIEARCVVAAGKPWYICTHVEAVRVPQPTKKWKKSQPPELVRKIRRAVAADKGKD